MQTYRSLRLSGPAKKDIANIAAFTAQRWGVMQKRRYVSKLGDALALLCERPDLGRPRDDVNDGLRAYHVAKHIIFYRETEGRLVVVRILHVRMDVVIPRCDDKDPYRSFQGPLG